MRLREVSTGIVVSVDDARGAAMVGHHWEPVEKPVLSDHKADEPAPKRPVRKSRK